MLSAGGSVRMFGIAATRGGYNLQASGRLYVWTKDYLRKAAVVDLGCAIVAVFVAVQLRSGDKVTGTYLALLVLWIVALWLAAGYDARFIGIGSDVFRKVRSTGVSPAGESDDVSGVSVYGGLDDVTAKLLDSAGPQTTIRLTAGLTLLHVDHPQLSGFRLVLKGLFDRCVAVTALILLTPLMATLAAASWLSDRGPVLFKQVRVGKDDLGSESTDSGPWP